MPKLKLEPLPFEEAMEFFADKVPVKPRDYYRAIFESYRELAFTVSGIASLNILADIQKELQKAIDMGTTAAEFGQAANEILARKGWEGLTPFQVDNVFRTNIQTAYNVGHYRRMTDPDIKDRFPYWMYDAVNDRRTRPTHMALDGKVYRSDHPFWDTWYPPNGYRCRCGVQALSEAEIRRRGLKVETEVPVYVEPPGQPARPLQPDPHFAKNPALAKWEPDLSKYPEFLAKAYEKRRRERDQRNGS